MISAAEAADLSLAKYDREIATGAPRRIATFYAVVEMRHATLGHHGDAQACSDCYGLPPTDKEDTP